MFVVVKKIRLYKNNLFFVKAFINLK